MKSLLLRAIIVVAVGSTLWSCSSKEEEASTSTSTTVTYRAYTLDDSNNPISNSEKQAGTFNQINDATIASHSWTMSDTGNTISVVVGKSCSSWSRTTSVSHTVNGVTYNAGHYHYNAADNTSYENGVYSWTEYGPEHSQTEIDTTCTAGDGGINKTVNSDNYTADVTIYLKIDKVITE
jgi:hypothetical protein